MSDRLDHLLNDAFAQFDAAERGSDLPVPGTLAVRHTVTHRRRVRYASFSVLGAMLIAVPVTLLIAGPHGNNSPPDVGNTGHPTVTTASPAPQPAPVVSPTPTTPAEVLNVTLNLPAFPGLATECGGAGTRTFVDGVADLGDSVKWTIGAMNPDKGDLDGAGGYEILTTIRCDTPGSVHATQLLALRVARDGRLSTLGYVINSRDVPNLAFAYEDVRIEAGVVLVTTSGPSQSDGWPACHHQVRGYAYRSGAFTQVSGPTSFPSPPTDIRGVDLRNAGLLVSISDPTGNGGAVYCVPMVDGLGTARVWIDGDPTKGSLPYTFTIGPVSFIPDKFLGHAAAGLVTYRSDGGATTASVQIFTLDGGSLVGNALLHSGVDGITGIEKVEVSGDQLVVTLTAAGTGQVWTYRQSAVSGTWQRSN